MDADPDEIRYSASELFDVYLAFIHDKRERQQMLKYDISPTKDTSVIVHFIGYVRNHDFKQRMQEIDAELKRLGELNERRKNRLFGPPTDGKLFEKE